MLCGRLHLSTLVLMPWLHGGQQRLCADAIVVQQNSQLPAKGDVDSVHAPMLLSPVYAGMLNAGVLALYVRGCGPVLGRRFMLTKTLEWNLYLCILDPMFDEHFHIRQVGV